MNTRLIDITEYYDILKNNLFQNYLRLFYRYNFLLIANSCMDFFFSDWNFQNSNKLVFDKDEQIKSPDES